jgi:hypothetical protein
LRYQIEGNQITVYGVSGAFEISSFTNPMTIQERPFNLFIQDDNGKILAKMSTQTIKLQPGTFTDINIIASNTTVLEENHLNIDFKTENPATEVEVSLPEGVVSCGSLTMPLDSPFEICFTNPSSVGPFGAINLTTASDFISISEPFTLTPGSILNLSIEGNVINFKTQHPA